MARAEKGDLIRVVKRECGHGYAIGAIVEVAKVTDESEIFTGEWYLQDDEYEIFRKAGEEDSDIMTPEQQVPPIDAPEYPEGTTFSPNGLFPIDKSEQDAVNHPNHYTQGRFEVIDVIEDAVEGADPFEAVCQANVLKYLLRYRHKNGIEDLKKARWYLDKLITQKGDGFNGK